MNMNKEKIQRVIRKMLLEHTKITSVTRGEENPSIEEYYFNFPDEKYLWSVTQSADGQYYFFYYPSSLDRSEFIRIGIDDLDSRSKDDLKQLFGLMKDKLFGFDSVLDDILSGY